MVFEDLTYVFKDFISRKQTLKNNFKSILLISKRQRINLSLNVESRNPWWLWIRNLLQSSIQRPFHHLLLWKCILIWLECIKMWKDWIVGDDSISNQCFKNLKFPQEKESNYGNKNCRRVVGSGSFPTHFFYVNMICFI